MAKRKNRSQQFHGVPGVNTVWYSKPVTIEKARKILDFREQNKQNKAIEDGAKQFVYGEVVILARNKKNADRKARNLGLIS